MVVYNKMFLIVLWTETFHWLNLKILTGNYYKTIYGPGKQEVTPTLSDLDLVMTLTYFVREQIYLKYQLYWDANRNL